MIISLIMKSLAAHGRLRIFRLFDLEECDGGDRRYARRTWHSVPVQRKDFDDWTRELLPQLPHATRLHISSGRKSRSQPTFSRTRRGKVDHRARSHRSNTLLWEKKAASAPTQVPTGRFCRAVPSRHSSARHMSAARVVNARLCLTLAVPEIGRAHV